MFPGFLTPVLTQLFFPKPPTTFLTCFCRDDRRKYAGKKSRLNRDRTHNHQVMSPTRSPLSHDALYWVRHPLIMDPLTPSQTSSGVYISAVEVFWKHCGKRTNCSWRAISPFIMVFSTYLKKFLHFYQILICRLQTLSVSRSLKLVI